MAFCLTYRRKRRRLTVTGFQLPVARHLSPVTKGLGALAVLRPALLLAASGGPGSAFHKDLVHLAVLAFDPNVVGSTGSSSRMVHRIRLAIAVAAMIGRCTLPA